MEKEYVMQVAQIIKEQLVTLTPMTVLMSWSIEEFAATLYRELPALRIKVNGRLHAGYVIVVLNGSDYYEVYLVKGMDVECVNSEVCFDELGGVIDRAIESGTDKAEHDKFCEQERQNLYVTVVTVCFLFLGDESRALSENEQGTAFLCMIRWKWIKICRS